jgi:hypothetical protein
MQSCAQLQLSLRYCLPCHCEQAAYNADPLQSFYTSVQPQPRHTIVCIHTRVFHLRTAHRLHERASSVVLTALLLVTLQACCDACCYLHLTDLQRRHEASHVLSAYP